MKTLISRFVASIVVAVMIGLAATGSASAQACIDSSAEIQALINEGRIISQYDALAQAGYSDDQLLNYRLCDQGGQYVWVLGVVSSDGTAQNLTVSAQ